MTDVYAGKKPGSGADGQKTDVDAGERTSTIQL